MMASAQRIDWQIGSTRLLLPALVPVVAMFAALEIASTWPVWWAFVGAVSASAVYEAVTWRRERCYIRTLDLIVGGVAVDSRVYQARRAWLGPGLTAIWLEAAGAGRLLYVMRREVTPGAYAALRRHVKSLEFL